MTSPPKGSPFPPNARRQLGLFAGAAIVGGALALATWDGPQILLPAVAGLLIAIGTLGFGRLLVRGIVTACAGPAYLWLAETTITLVALVLAGRVGRALVGLTWPSLISRGLAVLMPLSCLLLAAVCIRGIHRQQSLRRPRSHGMSNRDDG